MTTAPCVRVWGAEASLHYSRGDRKTFFCAKLPQNNRCVCKLQQIAQAAGGAPEGKEVLAGPQGHMESIRENSGATEHLLSAL